MAASFALARLAASVAHPADFFFEQGLAGYPDLPQDLLDDRVDPSKFTEEVRLAISGVRDEFASLSSPDKEFVLRQVADLRKRPVIVALDDERPGSGWTGFLRDDRQGKAAHAFQLKSCVPSTDFAELAVCVAKRRRLDSGLSLSKSLPFSDLPLEPGGVPCPVCGVRTHPSNLQASHLLPVRGYKDFLQSKLRRKKDWQTTYEAIRAQIAQDEQVVRYLNIANLSFLMSLRNMIPICAGQNGFINASLAVRKEGSTWVWEDFADVKRFFHGRPVTPQLEEQIKTLHMEPYLQAHFKLMKIFAPHWFDLEAAAEPPEEEFDPSDFAEDLRYWQNVLRPARPQNVGEWLEGVCA